MWYRFKIYQHFKKLKRIEEIFDPDVQKCIFKYKKTLRSLWYRFEIDHYKTST